MVEEDKIDEAIKLIRRRVGLDEGGLGGDAHDTRS